MTVNLLLYKHKVLFDAVIFNKGGKVFTDDRLEIAVVSSPDKSERYLIALSTPYYEGVEVETNRLAM